jgi:hypothetical protein
LLVIAIQSIAIAIVLLFFAFIDDSNRSSFTLYYNLLQQERATRIAVIKVGRVITK